MFFGQAIVHFKLSPDEFYGLTLREFVSAAHALQPDEEEAYTADEFFDEDEKATIADMKILAARKKVA